MARAATPVAFVNAIASAYTAQGGDLAAVLKQAQIAPSMLRQRNARITAGQFEILSGAAMQELDDEGLGAFDRRLPWGSYGMLARASLTSPTLGVALKRWCRHHGLLTESIALNLGVVGDIATVVVDEKKNLGASREFGLVHVLRNIHGLACWLIDSRIPLRGAAFPFAAPAHSDVYPLLFPGSVRFNAANAGLSFDARYLGLPLRRDEKALRHMLQRALPLTVLQYRRDRLLVQQVRQALADPAAAVQNAATLSAALNMSTRSLHRQLQEEGASLQQLKDEVRSERASDLLLRTSKPVKQVAFAAGFQNEKSFMRAFKGWTGKSPAEFRAARGNNSPALNA